VPTIGFLDEVGIDEDNRTDPKVYPDDFYEGLTFSAFGNDISHTTHITIHAPAEYTLNASGALVSDEVNDGIRTSLWESDHPINFFNVVAGKWAVRKGEGTAIYYLPGHEFNLDEMSSATAHASAIRVTPRVPEGAQALRVLEPRDRAQGFERTSLCCASASRR
jgi:hypothetical protein